MPHAGPHGHTSASGGCALVASDAPPATGPAATRRRRSLLLVEDDPDHAFLVRRRLHEGPTLDLDFIERSTAAGAATVLASGGVACVIADLNLPDATGLEVLSRLREVRGDVPVVVLTGLDSDEVGRAALAAGAQDYLVKGRDDPRALGRSVLFALERAQRQRAERRGHVLAAQLTALLEASAEGICWLDRDGACTFVNAAAAQLFGWPADDLIGQVLHDLAHLCPDAACRLRADLLGTAPVDAGEQHFRRRDGAELVAEVRLRPVSDQDAGQPIGLVVNLADVTERRRTRLQLAEREAQLVRAQRLARLGSWEWVPSLDEMTWSAELYRLTGLQPAEVPAGGRALDSYLGRVPADEREAVRACWQAAGLPPDRAATAALRHRLHLPDGRLRWVSLQVSRQEAGERGPARLLGSVQDVTEQQTTEQALEHLALHDPLTGLANRALLLDRLRLALESAGRTGGAVGVMFLDLDRFKLVNDTLSHAAGDALLLQVARRLTALLRPRDTLARLGGDEFVVVIDDLGSPAAAGTDPAEQERLTAMVQRVLDAFAAPFEVAGRLTSVSCSLGVAVSRPGDGADPESLLRDADSAMYRAKEHGRARVEFFDPALAGHPAAARRRAESGWA